MDKTGTYFVSGADDHLAKLFRLGNHAHRTTTNHNNNNTNNTSSIAYSQYHGATLICTLKGHAGVITDIDVSVDNALLATASEDGDCRIWGLRDGSPIAILRGHIGGVTMVSFSLTTPYHLTTTAEDGFARLWDVREATMKRYVSVVGNRTEYKSIPNNNNLNSSTGIITSGNRLNTSLFPPNDPTTSNPSTTTGTEATTTDDNNNAEIDTNNILPLPPIPIRQIHPANHGNNSNNNHAHGNILPPIPVAQPPIPQQQPPPPLPVPQFREFQPAVPIDGNDESILDEGVRLVAKLNHGPQDEDNEGMPFIETRSQRRKLKVVCLSRNPLGGQFATGCEDGVGRIWSDVDGVYSEGMLQIMHTTKSIDSSTAVVSTASPIHRRMANLAFINNNSGSLYTSTGETNSSPSSPSRPPVKPCYLLATLSGHLNAITDLQYSNRGDRILTASQKDGVVRIWSWDNASEFDIMMHDHFHSYTTRTMTTTSRAKGLQNLRQIMIRLVPLLDASTTTSNVAGGNSNCSSSRAVGSGSAMHGGRRGASSRVGASTSTTATANSSVSGSAVQCDVAVWTAHDLYIVTSQSIVSRQAPPLQVLQVWDSRDGQCLLSIQGAHASSCNIVLPHPLDPYILMSAGSDGVAHVWDMSSGSKLFSYENRLTHGSMAEPEHKNKLCAILDGCWNETSGVILLTDDSGRILLFDVASQCPSSTTPVSLAPSWMKEQYFASDYYEMIYDPHGYALDARSQMPPHLAPRAVRCTHTGTSVGDSVNHALLHLRGPWPITEAELSDRRKILLSRAFDVRRNGLKEYSNKPLRSCGSSSNSFILSKPYGGVLIYGPNAKSIPPAPTTNNSRSITTDTSEVMSAATALPSSRSARMGSTNNRPARPLSSRYHYLGYEDIISSEEEENNDEDFVPAAPTVAESVSDATSHDELELSSGSDMEIIDLSSATPPRRLRRGRTAAGRRLGGRDRSASAQQQGNQRSTTTSGSGQRSSQLQHRRRNTQRARLGRTRVDDTNNESVPLRRSSTKRGTSLKSKKRYEESDDDDDESVSEIEELLSLNRRPESRDAYNGQYFDDLQRGHVWKVPRGSEVFKDWLRRDESKIGYIGKKTYAPQVRIDSKYIVEFYVARQSIASIRLIS